MGIDSAYQKAGISLWLRQGSLYSHSQSSFWSSVSNSEGEKIVAKDIKVVNSPSLDTFKHKLLTLLEAVLHPKTEPTIQSPHSRNLHILDSKGIAEKNESSCAGNNPFPFTIKGAEGKELIWEEVV